MGFVCEAWFVIDENAYELVSSWSSFSTNYGYLPGGIPHAHLVIWHGTLHDITTDAAVPGTFYSSYTANIHALVH